MFHKCNIRNHLFISLLTITKIGIKKWTAKRSLERLKTCLKSPAHDKKSITACYIHVLLVDKGFCKAKMSRLSWTELFKCFYNFSRVLLIFKEELYLFWSFFLYLYLYTSLFLAMSFLRLLFTSLNFFALWKVNEGVREKENSDRLEWLQRCVQCDGLDEELVFNSMTNSLGPRKFLHFGVLHKVFHKNKDKYNKIRMERMALIKKNWRDFCTDFRYKYLLLDNICCHHSLNFLFCRSFIFIHLQQEHSSYSSLSC